MKKLKLIIPVIVIVVLFTGCSTLARYKSQKSPGLNDSLVNIDLFGLKLSEPDPLDGRKSLWDLNADAQSQLLKIYNLRYPDNESFLSAINNKYLDEGKNQVNNNYVRKDLRMVFSVSKSQKPVMDLEGSKRKFSIADRIEYVKISLSIRDPFVKFTGWNFFSTEYGTIDIANVSFTRTIDLSGSALSSKGKADVDKQELSVNGKASFSRKEEQALKFRYLKLNGRLNEDEIIIEQEGTREIDLTGNIIADVSLEFKKLPGVLTKISGLKDSSGKCNPPEKLKVENEFISVPRMDTILKEIQADLNMDYIYRKVVRGKKTYQEWDDCIKYYSGHISKPFTLLEDRDYVPGFYSLGRKKDNTSKDFVALKTPVYDAMPLFFSTYKEASDFLSWLKGYMAVNNSADPVKLNAYPLIFQDKDLTNTEVNSEGFGIIPVYW